MGVSGEGAFLKNIFSTLNVLICQEMPGKMLQALFPCKRSIRGETELHIYLVSPCLDSSLWCGRSINRIEYYCPTSFITLSPHQLQARRMLFLGL